MATIKTKRKGETVDKFMPTITVGNVEFLGGKSADEYETKAKKGYTVYSQEELDAIINKVDYPIQTIQSYLVDVTIPDLSLNGGSYFIIQYVHREDYQVQEAIQYAGNATTKLNRSYYGGVWNEWQHEAFADKAKNISITTDMWKLDTTTGLYKASIAWNGITTNHVVDVTFDLESIDKADGVRNYTESDTNYVYMYSDKQVESTLTGEAYAKVVVA